MNVKQWVGMVLVCLLIPSGWAFGQRVRLPGGTPVQVLLKADLASDQVAEGMRVDFEVARPVIIQGMTVIPEGAVSWGAIQSFKVGKFIRFDIEGVRLPDLTEVKLRTVGEKSKNPAKDQIKVDSNFRGGVGAPKGSEYTAYVDEDIEVAAAAPRSIPAPTAAPPPSPATPPTPAPVTPTPSSVIPAVTAPTPVAAPAVSAPAAPAPVTPKPSSVTPAVTAPTPVAAPAVSAPTAPAVTTPPAPAPSPASSRGLSAPPPGKAERVTVECFSDPTAADILIDGEFYGNTPSILKLPVGRHDLEIQLSGYKTYAIPLILQSGMGIRTIRASLEQRE
jgi:hypothetical protein